MITMETSLEHIHFEELDSKRTWHNKSALGPGDLCQMLPTLPTQREQPCYLQWIAKQGTAHQTYLSFGFQDRTG